MAIPGRGRFFLLALLSALCGLCDPWSEARAAGNFGPMEVGQAIAERRSRVAELQAIREAAEELGLRVWLFGGTAAGFAHYVRWDLEREAGDPRYRESFFDYDFTNIYRSTQDADLVVDGTPEQAERLEAGIRQRMSFLQGSKEHWEVRLLRQDRQAPGGQIKQALLANPDFLEQNTDSNSTGMIELTDPPPGETVVRDLRDWESPEPIFLQDVSQGRLHYYLSPTHQRTSRYLSGDNPPIFSVIRYLVKAFQYDLQVDGEDLAKVQAIIDAFEPRRDYARLSPWARGWLERYGPNLIRHSVNIEYAWDTLERLGLRNKLVTLSQPGQVRSLGWWLSREPLRTSQVGRGGGRTAADLGIEVVAHETSDFLAYESITRDTTLRPNVLISRQGHPGESAAQGPGFYTRLGRAGAKGTGLTIRFTVDPRAREGADFTVHGAFVVFTNRAALRVIPETLDFSILEYFQMLQAGESVDHADLGVWMKLKRRLSLKPLSPQEEGPVVALVAEALEEVARSPRSAPSPLLGEWFRMGAARSHPELVEKLHSVLSARIAGSSQRGPEPIVPLARIWLDLPEARRDPDLVKSMIGRPSMLEEFLVQEVLTRPEWNDPELVRVLIRTGRTGTLLAQTLLTRPEWAGHPDLVRDLIESRVAKAKELRDLLLLPQWHDPELARRFLDPGSGYGDIWLLASPQWADHPELLLEVIAREGPIRGRSPLDFNLLRSDHWRNNLFLQELCHGRVPTAYCLWQALEARAHPPEEPAPLAAEAEASWLAMVSQAIEDFHNLQAPPPLLVEWFGRPESRAHPELVQAMIDRGLGRYVATEVLTRPEWAGHPELVRSLIREGSATPKDLCALLVRRQWHDPALARLFMDVRGADALLLADPRWADHPELVLYAVARQGPIRGRSPLDFSILRNEHWNGHPFLRDFCGGRACSAYVLWQALQERSRADAAGLIELLGGLGGEGSQAGGGCP